MPYNRARSSIPSMCVASGRERDIFSTILQIGISEKLCTNSVGAFSVEYGWALQIGGIQIYAKYRRIIITGICFTFVFGQCGTGDRGSSWVVCGKHRPVCRP